EGAGKQADPGDQPGAPAAGQARSGTGRGPLCRPHPYPLRPGGPGCRRSPAGPGQLRTPLERAAGGTEQVNLCAIKTPGPDFRAGRFFFPHRLFLLFNTPARDICMKKTLTTLLMTAPVGLAQADMITHTVDYEIDGEAYQGLLVYDEAVTEPRPGLLMVPNWMGVTDNAAKKAYRAAGTDYVVFIADLYGRDIRPTDAKQASAAAGEVRSDR